MKTRLILLWILWAIPLKADEVVFKNKELMLSKLEEERISLFLEKNNKNIFLGEDGGGIGISMAKWFKNSGGYSFFLRKNGIFYGVSFDKKIEKFIFFNEGEEVLTALAIRSDKSLKAIFQFDEDGNVSKVQIGQGFLIESKN